MVDSASWKFWKENEKRFDRLAREIFGDEERILNEWAEWVLPPGVVNKQTVFEVWVKEYAGAEFAKRLKGLSQLVFPEIHKVALNYVSRLGDESVKYLNNFMSYSLEYWLQIFVIKGWSYVDLDKFSDGLKALLPKVTLQVYIQAFTINQKGLQMIFEESRNWRQLAIIGCRVDIINHKFQINTEYNYKLNKLDLKQTLNSK